MIGAVAISGREAIMLLRATLFVVQLAILAIWLVKLLTESGATAAT